MQLHSFRARSLSDALRLVREELGPDASVLHTREVGSAVARWLGWREIEVTASTELTAPSRWRDPEELAAEVPRAELYDFRRQMRDRLLAADEEPSLVEQLAAQPSGQSWIHHAVIAPLAQRLSRRGLDPGSIDHWLQRLDAELACDPDCHAELARERLQRIIAADLGAAKSRQLLDDLGPFTINT